MWDQIGAFGQTLVVIVTIASTAGFGLQWGHRKNIQARLDEERIHSDRQSKRVEETEHENAALEARNVGLVARIAALEAIKTNEEILARVAQQMTDFSTILTAHNLSAEGHWETQEELMTQMIAKMTGLIGLLERQAGGAKK